MSDELRDALRRERQRLKEELRRVERELARLTAEGDAEYLRDLTRRGEAAWKARRQSKGS